MSEKHTCKFCGYTAEYPKVIETTQRGQTYYVCQNFSDCVERGKQNVIKKNMELLKNESNQ
jgi:alpha-D-ribose 1-methylphosphonate 5-phosphate C-P lyase